MHCRGPLAITLGPAGTRRRAESDKQWRTGAIRAAPRSTAGLGWRFSDFISIKRGRGGTAMTPVTLAALSSAAELTKQSFTGL